MKVAVVENLTNKSGQKVSEIMDLVEAAGYTVAVHYKVELDPPHSRHYLPEVRLEKLKQLIQDDSEIEKVVFNEKIRPHQTYYLEEELGLDIIDKALLILEIFERKANSRDIKLQVQLAQLKYNLPRLVTKMSDSVRSERAGYGGTGEQVTDTLESDMQNRIKTIEKKLSEIKKQVDNRAREEIPRLPIVGYYSTGKSTLFNMLTQSERDTGHEAFTTMILKTTRSKLAGYPIDLIDTVGLVDLPTDILSAFELMLTEVFSFAGMILCLDTSLPFEQWKSQLEDYRDYVDRFTGDNTPRIIVALTKIDLVDQEIVQEMRTHLYAQEWLEKMIIIESRNDKVEETQQQFLTAFEELFADELTQFFYQHLHPSTASRIHDVARVENQEWHSDGTTSLSGIGPKHLLDELKGEIFQ